MKLIELELSDFQAHTATKIAFSPSITTIVGPTDIGKSAILRALRVICLNDIPGTHFVRDGAKRMKIRLLGIHKKERHEVVRTKNHDGATNTYELDGKELKAFGQGVPADVDAFLCMGEINFQDQHDAPFWFKETAGEVSRRLNAVVDLSIIDSTLSNITGMVKAAATRKESAEERLEDAEFKLAQLNLQRPRIIAFEKLSEASEVRRKTTRRVEKLESIIEEVTLAGTATEQFRSQAKVLEPILLLLRKALDLTAQREPLWKVVCSIRHQKSLLESAPPDFTLVETAFKKARKAGEDLSELAAVIRKVKEMITRHKEWVWEKDNRTTTLYLRTKDMNCPTCGKPI